MGVGDTQLGHVLAPGTGGGAGTGARADDGAAATSPGVLDRGASLAEALAHVDTAEMGEGSSGDVSCARGEGSSREGSGCLRALARLKAWRDGKPTLPPPATPACGGGSSTLMLLKLATRECGDGSPLPFP